MSLAVELVPTTPAHFDDLMDLWNDPQVMRWVGFPDGLGITRDGVEAWHERIVADPRRHAFVIVEPPGTFCGEAYYAVDAGGLTAGLDIKLRPATQGRGVATIALERLATLVFASEPAVDAVWTEPSAANRAARRLYTRCGFAPAPRPPHLPGDHSYWERRRRPAPD